MQSNYFNVGIKLDHIYELYQISIRYYSGIIVHIKNNDGGKNGNGICILKWLQCRNQNTYYILDYRFYEAIWRK